MIETSSKPNVSKLLLAIH